MTPFFQSFLALFVAIDFFGILPLFLLYTADMPPEEQRQTLHQSIGTAAAVGLIFLFGGPTLLQIMGIEVADFQIAGGLLLVVLSIVDLIQPEKRRRRPEGALGIVPLGIPLIAGPAVITTLLVLKGILGTPIVLATFLLNLGLLYVFLRFSGKLIKIIGPGGATALSKLIVLLLAAVGVMFIRQGIVAVFHLA